VRREGERRGSSGTPDRRPPPVLVPEGCPTGRDPAGRDRGLFRGGSVPGPSDRSPRDFPARCGRTLPQGCQGTRAGPGRGGARDPGEVLFRGPVRGRKAVRGPQGVRGRKGVRGRGGARGRGDFHRCGPRGSEEGPRGILGRVRGLPPVRSAGVERLVGPMRYPGRDGRSGVSPEDCRVRSNPPEVRRVREAHRGPGTGWDTRRARGGAGIRAVGRTEERSRGPSRTGSRPVRVPRASPRSR
jgi:hypothetical protein